MMRLNREFFILLALSVLVVIVCGVGGGRFFDVERTFEKTVYWYMWAHLGFLAVACARPDTWPRLVEAARDRRTWWISIAAAVLIAVTVASVGLEYRVLADETNLIGTSFSLYLDRTAQNIIEGEWYFARFHTLHAEMPTRPMLFPFAMAIVHSIVGFDGGNGFVVNIVAGIATLIAVGVFATRLAGGVYGALAMVFLAAFPLFAQCVTASGFEVLNLLMITLVGAQLWRFLRAARAGDAELLVILALLGAQCRYETAALFIPIGLAFLLRLPTLLAQPLPWTLALMPVLGLPMVWQRMEASVLNAGDDGKDPFSIAFLVRHLGGAAEYFFNPRGKYGSLTLICVLGVVGLAMLVWHAYKTRRHSPERWQFAWLSLLGGSLILGVQCAYYLGDMRLAFIARMGLSFVGAIVMLAAWPVARAVRAWPSFGKPLALVGALAIGVHGLAEAAVNEHGRSLFLYREYKRTLAYLLAHPNEGRLIITDRPSMYAARGMSAVSFASARKTLDQIYRKLRKRTYDEVFVLQHVLLDGDQPEEGFALEGAPLETVYEFQNTDRVVIRIARLKQP